VVMGDFTKGEVIENKTLLTVAGMFIKNEREVSGRLQKKMPGLFYQKETGPHRYGEEKIVLFFFLNKKLTWC